MRNLISIHGSSDPQGYPVRGSPGPVAPSLNRQRNPTASTPQIALRIFRTRRKWARSAQSVRGRSCPTRFVTEVASIVPFLQMLGEGLGSIRPTGDGEEAF